MSVKRKRTKEEWNQVITAHSEERKKSTGGQLTIRTFINQVIPTKHEYTHFREWVKLDSFYKQYQTKQYFQVPSLACAKCAKCGSVFALQNMSK